jgi:hypothetical protein
VRVKATVLKIPANLVPQAHPVAGDHHPHLVREKQVGMTPPKILTID